MVALIGGLLGIVGAVVQEVFSGGGLPAIFVGAPIIEEFMKPTGVYLLLLFFPFLLRSQLQKEVDACRLHGLRGQRGKAGCRIP